MTAVSLPLPVRVRQSALGRPTWSAVLRSAVLALGLFLIAAGLPLALLPGHLGVPLMIVGAIMVLRASRTARRSFVQLQHRHPNVVVPIRRLLRREPEVFAVAWQQLLRIERGILPRHRRMAVAMRHRLIGRG